MFTLGTELHDWELGLWARSWKVLHHLMLCDITAVDHEVRAFSEATEKVDVPVYRWFVARWRASEPCCRVAS